MDNYSARNLTIHDQEEGFGVDPMQNILRLPATGTQDNNPYGSGWLLVLYHGTRYQVLKRMFKCGSAWDIILVPPSYMYCQVAVFHTHKRKSQKHKTHQIT
jgi:hypothetical protein